MTPDSKTWTILGGFAAVLAVVPVVLYLYRRRSMKEVKQRGEEGEIPGGSYGWPLVGETLDFIACGYSTRPVSFMEKRAAMYGKVFRSHLLGKAIIVSTDPEVNKVVMQNQANAFIPHYPKSIAELLGKYSILAVNGPVHKRLHSHLGGFLRSPQFKAQITRDIQTTVRRCLSSWIDVVEEQHRPIYVQDECKKMAFEIMTRTLMSVGPGEDLELLRREFEEYSKGLISLPIKLPGTTLYKSLKAKGRMVKVIRGIIEQKRVQLNNKGEAYLTRDTADILLRDTLDESSEPRLPLDSIPDNIIEMMIPGEETVPTAMTLAVNYLSHAPAALASLVEENMELMKRKMQSGDEYEWTDYISLPFTQNVISETLRMGNIINAVWREAVKDVTIKGHFIPKGWCVLASFSSLHMDEANYESPYEFNPHRWERIEGNLNSNNKYTPFGGGQRLCPGLELSRLEIAIFLHHLVTTYRWVAEDDSIIYFPFVKLRRKLPIAITPITPPTGTDG